MAAKTKTKTKTEAKVILEREYIVPLRKGWLKVAEYKRANKAVKTLKEFIARHMKIYDRDLRSVKLDMYLNNEIRARGMRKPPAKISIKAKKFDDGIVRVELSSPSEALKFRKEKHERLLMKGKKSSEKKEEKQETKEEKKEKAESVETKEKEIAAQEESMTIAKEQAREAKHVSKIKEPKINRTALKK